MAEVVVMEPQPGCSQVHERHLEMLSQLGVCVEEEARAAAERPWAVYAEDLGEGVDCGGGGGDCGGDDGAAVAQCYSLDAPLVLNHVVEAAATGLSAASAADEVEEMSQ